MPEESGPAAEFCFRNLKGRNITNVSARVTNEEPSMMRVYRDEISRHLIDEARRLYPDAITFHFASLITSINIEKQIATTGSPSEEV